MLQSRLIPQLDGVQETMLWTLYERATEAMRPDGSLRDPECIQIYQSIDYDFPRHFGIPRMSLGVVRAQRIDLTLRDWLRVHPSGFVVSLGEGLETGAYRVDNGRMRWLSVDLPDAIAFRERFLKPTERFKHAAMSALDPAWMELVDDRQGLFIVAQGILMYLRREQVRELIESVADRFPGSEMMFDLISRPLSEATQRGHDVTPHWTAPVMPWGLNRDKAVATIRSWVPTAKAINCRRLRPATQRPAILEDILDFLLPHRQKLPSIVHVRL